MSGHENLRHTKGSERSFHEPYGGGHIPQRRARGDVPRLCYRQAFSFVTGRPKWLRNLLMLTVMLQVPVVGLMVGQAYQADLERYLHGRREGDGSVYPEFQLDDFAVMISRGMAPAITAMLLVLIFGAILMVLMMVVVFLPMGLVFLTAMSDAADASRVLSTAYGAMYTGLFFMVFFFGLVMSLFARPMMMRAAWTEQLGEAFNFRFILDFIKRTWWEQIKTACFLMITSFLFQVVGMCLCIIGAFPAGTWTWLAYSHFDYQLYEIYLARGGEPIPFADRDGEKSLF